jgi:hypothetical protein
MSIKSINAFKNLWSAARNDPSTQSYKVSYAELKTALGAITADGKVSRAEAAAVADVMANDPVMTGPAVKVAQEFLLTVGSNHSLDAATKSAVMAEFALRAARPFSHLEIPGRVVKNSIDLPASVQKAIADTAERGGGTWEEVETRKTTLAGQPVFIVNYNSLDGEFDYEKVRIFSATGKQIAEGAINDPMAGFGWQN